MTPLLIGLGNPGSSYAGNRHNIGFMVIERIMADYAFARPAAKFNGIISEGIIDTQKTYAFKPMTYMNNSGAPAGELVRFYKIPLQTIFIFHDELDLPMGKIRIKRGGGHGGHNGLKNLDAHLGQDYIRVRIGIGHPGDKDLVSDYVLSDFRKEEKAQMHILCTEMSRHLPMLLQGDEAGFMNKITLAIPAAS